MIIATSRIADYLVCLESIPVRKSDNTPGYVASRSEALMLVAAGCVEGRGSEVKLRYLRLLYPVDVAERMAQAEADQLASRKNTPAEDKLMALDALQRIASARKFTFKETCGPYRVICHKRPVDGFASPRWIRQA